MSTTLSQSLLPEFDHEMANTRRTLERVPDDRPDFRPHARSMTLARLAGHLAEIPTWATTTLTVETFDMTPAEGSRVPAYTMSDRASMLAHFDTELAKARAALIATTDAAMTQPWTLKDGGHVVLTMPRIAVLRTFVLNHNIHHRAQLGVYLRLNDIPVPSTYGRSADEGGM